MLLSASTIIKTTFPGKISKAPFLDKKNVLLFFLDLITSVFKFNKILPFVLKLLKCRLCFYLFKYWQKIFSLLLELILKTLKLVYSSFRALNIKKFWFCIYNFNKLLTILLLYNKITFPYFKISKIFF